MFRSRLKQLGRFFIRFGLWKRVLKMEHGPWLSRTPSSSGTPPETVSTTLKHQRNCESRYLSLDVEARRRVAHAPVPQRPERERRTVHVAVDQFPACSGFFGKSPHTRDPPPLESGISALREQERRRQQQQQQPPGAKRCLAARSAAASSGSSARLFFIRRGDLRTGAQRSSSSPASAAAPRSPRAAPAAPASQQEARGGAVVAGAASSASSADP